MKIVKREKATSTRGHYVTNAQLLPAVVEAKTLGKVTDKLAGMIWMVAERYSRKSNFIGYSFREDMVSAAVMNLCNTALKFNTEKYSNPFAYYTSAIHNSFLQYMAEEKKHRTVRDKLLIDAGANPSFNYLASEEKHELTESDNTSFNPAPFTNPDDFEEHHYSEGKFEGLKIDEETGELKQKAPKIKYRFQARQPGEARTMVPGVDFIQHEDGTVTFTDGAAPTVAELKKPPKETTAPKRQRAVKEPKAPKEPKTPRAKKVKAE